MTTMKYFDHGDSRFIAEMKGKPATRRKSEVR